MSKLSNDQRAKRLLSPESNNLLVPDKLDKRQRHDSIFIEEDTTKKIDIMASNVIPERDLKSWMELISGLLEQTATKQDLDNINNRIDAQGVEIKQLREEVSEYKKDFDNLRVTIDQNEAKRLNSEYETTDRNRTPRFVNNNMAATSAPRLNNARNNLVIEGLKGESEEEMTINIIEMASEIGAIIYMTDIANIFRMKRRDEENRTPGPVLVTFNRVSIRDNILKKKVNLRHVQGMANVYVNPDEPMEIRRAKAILRKVAITARQHGELTEKRHDRVTIGKITYSLDELHKIPSKYLAEQQRETGRPSIDDQGAASMEVNETEDIGEQDGNNEKRERYATAKRRLKSAKTAGTTGPIIQGERMRITPAGLLFSGPTAYPSNLYKAPVTYEDKDFTLNEQAYQDKKAKNHDKDELAETLLDLTDTWEIKYEGGSIVVTEEWNRNAPDLLWELFDNKMIQNPDLL